jgi:HJR/Mrr/RecB family endonuclease
VLVPLAVVAGVAASASVGALHVHAAVLRGGAWAWLGDAAVVLDVCGALALLGVPAAVRRERVSRSGIGDVDVMSGGEFEERLAVLFADLGYAVTRTGASGDFGADLLLEFDGEPTVVQAKRYDGSVGIEAVQQVIGATRYYDASDALVVTNSTCTPAAVSLASVHGVELIEREALVGLLAAHPLPTARSPALGVLVREIAGGAALLFFAAGMVLRMVWWMVQATLRLSAARRRPGR